jgi:RNA polymerase sigma-70 factor (ECF subfamily)
MVAEPQARPSAQLGEPPKSEMTEAFPSSGLQQRNAGGVQRASSRPRLRVVADSDQPVVGHPGRNLNLLTPAPFEPVYSTENAESNPGRTAAAISDADFKRLYDTHLRLVKSSLSRLGVPEEDLMDLTQKVFLTAYLKLPGFEGRSLLSTWLWSISRRVAIAHRRSEPQYREVATDPSAFEGLMEEPNNVTSNGESALFAQAILSKLTETQRVVFLLFEVEQLTGREIATLLSIPLGTVRSRLRYAREFFQREAERLRVFQEPVRRQQSSACP